jgi:rhodanese-related sulfurtransferase
MHNAGKDLSIHQMLLLMGFVAVIVVTLMINGLEADKQSFDIVSVDIPQAKLLIDSGAVILDVRGQKGYSNRHIPAAIHIPVVMLRAGLPEILGSLKERDIVVYCNDGHHAGPEAVNILTQAGFSKVVNISDGIEGWAAAGLPVSKS